MSSSSSSNPTTALLLIAGGSATLTAALYLLRHRRQLSLETLNLSLGVGRSRRMLINTQISAYSPHSNTRTRILVVVRLESYSCNEIRAMLVLLVARWILGQLLVPLAEDVEYVSVLYLSSLRCPKIAWRVSSQRGL